MALRRHRKSEELNRFELGSLSLTPRGLEILELLGAGNPLCEVADAIGVSRSAITYWIRKLTEHGLIKLQISDACIGQCVIENSFTSVKNDSLPDNMQMMHVGDHGMRTKAVAGVIVSLFLASMLASAHAINLGTEIAYDDGSAEIGISPGSPLPTPFMHAVQFTAQIAPALVIGMRFWLCPWGQSLAPLQVHVLDYPSFSEMIIPFEMTPDLGWNDVDLSPYNIVVTGDFILALEWTVEMTDTLGVDTSGPDHLRSWTQISASPWELYSTNIPPEYQGNFMIRAVVAKFVDVDIKPGSWPNPLQLNPWQQKDTGVLPISVCGTKDFDVTTIDPETIQLTLEGLGVGVAPLRWSYEDVATPYEGEPCGGHDLGGDGYLDLTLKFNAQEVTDTLGLEAFHNGDVVILILTGNLKEEFDGTPIQGRDCIVILYTLHKKEKK